VVVGCKYFLPVPEYQFFIFCGRAIFSLALTGSAQVKRRMLTASGVFFRLWLQGLFEMPGRHRLGS
jgi:hypothetical protein